MDEEKVLGNVEEIEKALVEKFLKLDAEIKRETALLDEKKKAKDAVEAELLDLLDAEGKKTSATFRGIGHVTCRKPRVGQAWITEGQEEAFFEFLKKEDRADLIKTKVEHPSLCSFITEQLEQKNEAPPGVGYILVTKLTAFPERK